MAQWNKKKVGRNVSFVFPFSVYANIPFLLLFFFYLLIIQSGFLLFQQILKRDSVFFFIFPERILKFFFMCCIVLDSTFLVHDADFFFSSLYITGSNFSSWEIFIFFGSKISRFFPYAGEGGWTNMTERSQKKTSVCTGTRGGSETSLNTVVHVNVKVLYEPVCKFFFEIFLNFFKNWPHFIFL